MLLGQDRYLTVLFDDPTDLERVALFSDGESERVPTVGGLKSHRIELLLLLLEDQELLLLGELEPALQTKPVQNRLELLVLLNRRECATRLLSTDIIRNHHRLGDEDEDEDTAEVLDEAILQVGDGVVGLLRRWRPRQKLYL